MFIIMFIVIKKSFNCLDTLNLCRYLIFYNKLKIMSKYNIQNSLLFYQINFNQKNHLMKYFYRFYLLFDLSLYDLLANFYLYISCNLSNSFSTFQRIYFNFLCLYIRFHIYYIYPNFYYQSLFLFIYYNSFSNLDSCINFHLMRDISYKNYIF